jgi:dephospho-CoA kinase
MSKTLTRLEALKDLVQQAIDTGATSVEQIHKIIQAQMPRAEKQRLADDIVLNDGHLDHLYSKLEVLHQQYLKRAMQ